MTLLTLFLSLKAAIEARDWKKVLNLVADLVKQFTDPVVTAAVADDLEGAVAGVLAAAESAKGDTVEAAATPNGISPDQILQLVLLVIDIWKKWKR